MGLHVTAYLHYRRSMERGRRAPDADTSFGLCCLGVWAGIQLADQADPAGDTRQRRPPTSPLYFRVPRPPQNKRWSVARDTGGRYTAVERRGYRRSGRLRRWSKCTVSISCRGVRTKGVYTNSWNFSDIIESWLIDTIQIWIVWASRMDPKINDHLDGLVVSQPSTSDTIAVVESIPCRISDSSKSSCSSGGNRREHFKAQLESQVHAVQHGHRGLESALHLMCERLLDLEDCWQQAREVSCWSCNRWDRNYFQSVITPRR